MNKYCGICNGLSNEIFKVGKDRISSLSNVFPDGSITTFCSNCTHLATYIETNEEIYYENNYPISLKHEEDDQVYEVVDGNQIFRNEHQFKLIEKYLLIEEFTKILDFGAAKGSVASQIVKKYGADNTFVYDVSNTYEKFWNKTFKQENQAVKKIPTSWSNFFDVVLSLFVLEHVSEVNDYMNSLTKNLKVGGKFFAIVPNVFDNPSDLLVSDHPNHFTKLSLLNLLESHGFNQVIIHDNEFRGAFLVVATYTPNVTKNQTTTSVAIKIEISKSVANLCDYWVAQHELISSYSFSDSDKIAIYGAGVYGVYIFTQLPNKDKFSCFIDSNPYLQGENRFGYKIASPSNLPSDVNKILVGLNPLIARTSITNVSFNGNDNDLEFIYMHEYVK